jgi:hypothetical protein
MFPKYLELFVGVVETHLANDGVVVERRVQETANDLTTNINVK